MIKRFFLTIIILMAFVIIGYSQQITGTTKSESNLHLSQVNILVGNTIVAVTDENGNFILPKEIHVPVEIQFQHPDYVSKSVVIVQQNGNYILARRENLAEVFIKGMPQKESNVIVPTSKVTSETLENYSPLELTTTLNSIPGISVQAGALNTNRIIIRGVGSRTLYGTNKIRAYFNGIPITNGAGETAIDVFNPEDLESLEIVKGPKATQFGTNLGGTLLLKSKKPLPNSATLNTALTAGSFGLFKNSIGANYSGEEFNVHLNYDFLTLDGFRNNSAYLRKNYLLNATYSLSKTSSFDLLFTQTDYVAEIASSLGKTDFEENPEQAAATWALAKGFEDNEQALVGLSFTHRFSPTFENVTRIFYTYTDHYEPRPFNILKEHTQGFGGRTLFTKTFLVNKNRVELSLGAELYKDEYDWKTLENLYEDNHDNGSLEGFLLSNNKESRNQLNVFASVILPFLQKFIAQFGVNFNSTQFHFADKFNFNENSKSAKRNFDAIFAPNLNLSYLLFPEIKLYANVSRGFNFPSVEETLTPEGVINPEIGPEKGWNFEMGTDVFLFKKTLHFGVSLYRMEITDLLVAQRTGDDQYIGRNAGKTSHSGIEFSADYIINITKKIQLQAFANATFNHHTFVEFKEEEHNFSGNDLTGLPDKTIAAGINFKHSFGFYFYSNLQHTGSVPMNDSNSLYSKRYTVANLKAGYSHLVFPGFTVEGNLGINNITDTKYASAILINATAFGDAEPRYYYPGTPRNCYAGLKISFEF